MFNFVDLNAKLILITVSMLIGSTSYIHAQQSNDELSNLTKAFEDAYGSNDASGQKSAAETKPLLGGRTSEFTSAKMAQRKFPMPSLQETTTPPSIPGSVGSAPQMVQQASRPDNGKFQQVKQVSPDKQDSQRIDQVVRPTAPTIQPMSTGIGPIVTRNADTMWWQPMVIEPLDERGTQPINPELLIQLALQNSPKILATSMRPLIRQTEIGESIAEFDPEVFVQSQFDDRVDPVGNQLTTGNGSPFLQDHIWYGDAGFRKKLKNGGEFEAKQRLGFQNSNSRFFDPQDQGTTTLSMNFSQPLLRGKGVAYNRSQIVIAQISHQASWDQYSAELQDELTDVVEAYWTLYYHRSVLLQKQYNVERGVNILQRLEGRSGLDTLPSQIARARAAVQSRCTELANARRDVKNAETEIRRLIGSRDNFQANATELLPMETPVLYRANEDLGMVIEQSIQMRPEVKQSMQRAKIAAVQKNVSEHELLPELNLIFSSYVSALRGSSKIFNAWGDQFTKSTPGYALGVEFNLPYGRRAARSRDQRQQLVLEQVRHEIDQTVNEVVAETQIAWRQIDSAYQTTKAAAESIKAARTDLLQNEARWESFALVEGDLAEGQTPTTLLDQLLDAQQRLTNSELTYSQALLEFKISEIGLKRATGKLLNHQPLPASPVEQTVPAYMPEDPYQGIPQSMYPAGQPTAGQPTVASQPTFSYPSVSGNR